MQRVTTNRKLERFWTLPRLVIALIGIAVIAAVVLLGYVGISRQDPTAGTLDVLYWDIQLLVFSSPPVDGHDASLNLLLQIARFVAAPIAVVASVGVGVSEPLSRVLQRSRASRFKGHVIIVGQTRLANSIADALGGYNIVPIDRGDARSLIGANVATAAHLFAAEDDTADTMVNITTARNAAALRPPATARLAITAHVTDPLTTVVQAAMLAMLPGPAVIRLVNHEAVAAASAVDALRPELDNANFVIVAGLSEFGVAVLVALARARAGTQPLRVTVVTPSAHDVAAVEARWPEIRSNLAISVIESVLDGATLVAADEEPAAVFICYGDDELNLRAASAAATWIDTPHGATVVHLDQFAPDDESSSVTVIEKLFDPGISRLRIVDVADQRSLLGGSGDYLEALAKGVHEQYLKSRLTYGEVIGSSATLRSWKELPEAYKTANRAQAGFYPEMLRLAGCFVALRTGDDPPIALTDDEVEALSMYEHRRWVIQRRTAGWVMGQQRSNRAKRHPELVPWENLHDSSRDRDRDAVRFIHEAFVLCLRARGLTLVRRSPMAPRASINLPAARHE